MEFNSTQLTYLDALGIDVWMPRDNAALDDVLAVESSSVAHGSTREAAMAAVSELLQDKPAASRAPAAEQPLAAQAAPSVPVQPDPVQPAAHQEPGANHTHAHIQPSAVPSPATASTQISSQSADAASSDTSAVPHFHLQFWCYSSGFWFVSSYQGIRPEHHKFVHNLALYLQGPLHGKKRKPKHVGVFSWPMIDAPNIDQSEQVARTYLTQHLQQLQQLSPAQTLIALDESHQWLPADNRVCLDTHLDNALTSASEKVRIWQQLQSYRLK